MRIKRAIGILLIIVVGLLTLACSEGGMRRTATAIGIGHGGTVTEVTIIIDGNGDVISAKFDEIMPISYVGSMSKARFDALSSANQTQLILPVTAKSEVGGEIVETVTYYYRAIYLHDRLFVATVKTDNNGSETFAGYYERGNDNPITNEDTGLDLNTYCASKEGVEWYYNAYANRKAFYGILKDSVYEKSTSAITTDYGTMRKSYSTYWSPPVSQFSGLGWKGNMDALERYLITYGFDGLDILDHFDDSERKEEVDEVIQGPVAAEGKNYVVINGVTTGATLSRDTYMYLGVAKRAYNMALEM